ncbi:GNAT family N-acetyltransferase [Actinoplanes sp. GCM10030250]|uniref:GNAT family N-acetyltransferase n=1 Tax=Actinoplanes sp. GCM10030250 TaxID=3273376 RepID=UPI00361C620C
MTPRTATPADHDAVVELAAAFYAEDGFATPRAELAANLRVLMAAQTARVAVIDLDGAVVAFGITTTVFGLENGLVAELEDLYVAPHARRRGLAQQLIDDSADWARALGAPHLNITIAPNGLDVSHLLRYYAARGFRDEGRSIITLPL